MYCTNCGNPLNPNQNFCGNCGTPAASPDKLTAENSAGAFDWQESSDYLAILNHPEVQRLIEKVSGKHPNGMSAQDFLCAAKPLLTAAGIGTIPLGAIVDIVPGWYSKMGINTGKSQRKNFRTSIGCSIAAALCSFASRSQTLINGLQAVDGCVIHAKIPSSMFVFGGEITATFSQLDGGTQIEIGTKVPGQIYDWGTSKRLIANLFKDIPEYLDTFSA